MKKLLLAALIAAPAMQLSAQELVKTLYTGEPKEVTWENTLSIDAEAFRDENVKVGDYIYITFDKTSDVIELKSDGTWLPGTRFVSLGDNTPSLSTYITADMLTWLRNTGLELCGASFTVNEVSIYNDGFQMPDGAIWGGYFWVSDWNTLELFKTAFNSYADQRYMDIYLSEDNGENENYFMKVLTAWDNDDAIWANNDQIEHGTRMATVDLLGINVAEALADVNTLMVQSNPEGGNPYNITAIALRSDLSTVAETLTNEAACADLYSISGILLKKNVSAEEALTDMPAGLYIFGGKKIAKN